MSTKNIECQLAKGQIGRYLNGDRFSAEAVKQLEAHIAECDECTALLAERKKAVMAMMGEIAATRAVVQMDVPSRSESAAERLVSALVRTVNEEKPAETASGQPKSRPAMATLFPKPVLYCGALAIVLMGMSYLSRGALKTFGPIAGQALPAETGSPRTPPRPTPAAPKSAAVRTQTPLERAATIPPPARSTPPPPIDDHGAPVTAHPTPAPRNPAPAPRHPVPGTRNPVLSPRHPAPGTRNPTRRLAAGHPTARIVVRRVAWHSRRPIHPRKLRRTHAPRTGVRVYDPQGRPLP